MFATQENMWRSAFDAWAAARRIEQRYDESVWSPAFHNSAGTPEIEAEMERLQHVRCKLEDGVFAVPALNASQLATKMLMAFDDGREADFWLPSILNDCRRFADDSLTSGKLSDDLGASRQTDRGHRGWLRERSIAFAEANAGGMSDFEQGNAEGRMGMAECLLMATPSVTDDDVIARLVTIAQIVAEGSEPSVNFALDVLREAIAHFGMGCDAPLAAAETTEDSA